MPHNPRQGIRTNVETPGVVPSPPVDAGAEQRDELVGALGLAGAAGNQLRGVADRELASILQEEAPKLLAAGQLQEPKPELNTPELARMYDRGFYSTEGTRAGFEFGSQLQDGTLQIGPDDNPMDIAQRFVAERLDAAGEVSGAGKRAFVQQFLRRAIPAARQKLGQIREQTVNQLLNAAMNDLRAAEDAEAIDATLEQAVTAGGAIGLSREQVANAVLVPAAREAALQGDTEHLARMQTLAREQPDTYAALKQRAEAEQEAADRQMLLDTFNGQMLNLLHAPASERPATIDNILKAVDSARHRLGPDTALSLTQQLLSLDESTDRADISLAQVRREMVVGDTGVGPSSHSKAMKAAAIEDGVWNQGTDLPADPTAFADWIGGLSREGHALPVPDFAVETMSRLLRSPNAQDVALGLVIDHELRTVHPDYLRGRGPKDVRARFILDRGRARLSTDLDGEIRRGRRITPEFAAHAQQIAGDAMQVPAERIQEAIDIEAEIPVEDIYERGVANLEGVGDLTFAGRRGKFGRDLKRAHRNHMATILAEGRFNGDEDELVTTAAEKALDDLRAKWLIFQDWNGQFLAMPRRGQTQINPDRLAFEDLKRDLKLWEQAGKIDRTDAVFPGQWRPTTQIPPSLRTEQGELVNTNTGVYLIDETGNYLTDTSGKPLAWRPLSAGERAEREATKQRNENIRQLAIADRQRVFGKVKAIRYIVQQRQKRAAGEAYDSRIDDYDDAIGMAEIAWAAQLDYFQGVRPSRSAIGNFITGIFGLTNENQRSRLGEGPRPGLIEELLGSPPGALAVGAHLAPIADMIDVPEEIEPREPPDIGLDDVVTPTLFQRGVEAVTPREASPEQLRRAPQDFHDLIERGASGRMF